MEYPLQIFNAVNNRLSAIVLVLLATACRSTQVSSGPQVIQPGAPGQQSREVSATKTAAESQLSHTEADTRFMQGMIGHHAQAIEMSALVPTRTARDEMRLLAKRIDVSQADEIKMMQEWLQRRGQKLPDPHAHHQMGATLMPGMLSQEEMARLGAAKGDEFDRLFLQGMIKHHMGALTMVQELFASPGAGQESEIFAFASDVDADQRMEIDRMGAVLATIKELQQ